MDLKKKVIYKMTNVNMQTFGRFQWELGVWKHAPGKGALCTDGWLHAYSHPLLAVLYDPIHSRQQTPLLFQGRGGGKMKDDMGIKQGWERMVLDEEIPLPVINKEEMLNIALKCAIKVYKEKMFVNWAKKWIKVRGRTDEVKELGKWREIQRRVKEREPEIVGFSARWAALEVLSAAYLYIRGDAFGIFSANVAASVVMCVRHLHNSEPLDVVGIIEETLNGDIIKG